MPEHVADTGTNEPDGAGDEEAAATTGLRPRAMLVPVGQFCSAIAILAGVALALHLTLAPDHPDVDWLLRAALAVAVAALVYHVSLRHEARWSRPLRDLEKLVHEVHAGEAPIDELASVNGPLAPVAAAMAAVFRDLRTQRQAVLGLNREVDQRVAHRTDALERLIRSLRTQATRDPLTGLYNRRMLDQDLPHVVAQCHTDGSPLSVMMMDVDHFKDLNDTLGHAAGDELLRSLGQLIRSTLRDQDMAFRCGGDEFLIALPGTDRAGATALSKRLTSLVDGLAQTLRVPRKPRLSIGLACLGEIAEPSADALLKKADAALYEVKAQRKAVRRAVAAPHAAPTAR